MQVKGGEDGGVEHVEGCGGHRRALIADVSDADGSSPRLLILDPYPAYVAMLSLVSAHDVHIWSFHHRFVC